MKQNWNLKNKITKFPLKTIFRDFKNKFLIIDKRICIIIVLSLCLIITLILFCLTNKESKNTTQVASKYILEDELIPPKEPLLPDSYLLNRVTPETWPKEDCNKFFTQPTGEVFQQIQLSNDQIIKNILEDTP